MHYWKPTHGDRVVTPYAMHGLGQVRAEHGTIHSVGDRWRITWDAKLGPTEIHHLSEEFEWNPLVSYRILPERPTPC